MEKKYEIKWRDSQQTVLIVTFQPPLEWAVGLAANIEAMEKIKEMPHDVILLHDTSGSKISLLGIGGIHDIFYNKLPSPPKNLKMVITVFNNLTITKSVSASMEILDKVFFKRRYAYIVANMEEADRLITQAGF